MRIAQELIYLHSFCIVISLIQQCSQNGLN